MCNPQFETHSALTTGMAKALGVDLLEEMAEGRLSLDELRLWVSRCERCPTPDQCAAFIAGFGDRTLPRAPACCQNKDVLDLLARAQRSKTKERLPDE